jgi:hypothetical protein
MRAVLVSAAAKVCCLRDERHTEWEIHTHGTITEFYGFLSFAYTPTTRRKKGVPIAKVTTNNK